MKKIFNFYFITIVVLTLTKNVFAGNSININREINADYAILMDYETNEILYQKNIDEIIAPSSMTKIMTAYVIFDMLENKEIKLNDLFKVSVKAWKEAGSRMFLEPEWRVSVDDLLKGLLVVSGNDAAIVLAEGSSGSIENFVNRMNKTAANLGLNNTNFVNPNGLYASTHYMSVRDLAILTKALVKNHYKYYKKYFSIVNYNFNGINQKNRNWLLTEYKGTDGVKTGFTDQGKYSMVASTERNGKRFIAVLAGAESERDRINQTKKLLDFGYNQYQYISLFDKGDIVAEINVFFSKTGKVPIYTKDNIFYSTKKSRIDNLRVNLIYDRYKSAPIKKDEKVAELRIVDGNFVKKYDLYAENDVEPTTKFEKFKTLFKYYASSILKNE